MSSTPSTSPLERSLLPDPDLKLESLEPFGLAIRALRPRAVASLAPVLLEELAQREKLVVLRGFEPIGRDDFLAYCRSFPGRSLLEWDFGPVMEMHERPDAKNYLFSREAVPFHWDGAFHQVPSYLMFCCVEAPLEGAGGETLFCDTRRVYVEAAPEERARMDRVQLTFETAKLAHYGGKITGPLVQTHPVTGEPTLRFAEPVETALNPVTLAIDGIPESERETLLSHLTARVHAPENCYGHRWMPADILIADNHALIHGRRAFERDCPRHLRRIQVL